MKAIERATAAIGIPTAPAHQCRACKVLTPADPSQVLHRMPGATSWEVGNLERALDRVAELVQKTRDATFIEPLSDGRLVSMTPAIFSLGGATLDNEWNHMHQKLMCGLGVVAIKNGAHLQPSSNASDQGDSLGAGPPPHTGAT